MEYNLKDGIWIKFYGSSKNFKKYLTELIVFNLEDATNMAKQLKRNYNVDNISFSFDGKEHVVTEMAL